MAVDLHRARSVAPLVEHIKAKVPLDKASEIAAGGAIANAILRFEDDWDEEFERGRRRLERTIDGLDQALAAMVADWTFAEGEVAPFESEAGAFDWLQLHGPDDTVISPDAFFASVADHRIQSVWRARQKTREDLWNLLELDEHVRVEQPRYVETKSRLSAPVKHLIEDLCRAWFRAAGELGLPRNDPNPDNPLLRFLDAALGAAMGEGRPSKGTVRNLVRLELRSRIVDDEQSRPECEDYDGVETFRVLEAIRFHGD